MLRVGLTGGIGSGKSTVANLFATLGATVIDADQVARDVTLPGSVAFPLIAEKFGPDILSNAGTLNRIKLRQIIFSDPQAKIWLEALLHPLIKQSISAQIQTIDYPYCIIAIPLLVETESYELIDRILVIESDHDLRLQRVMDRDHAPLAIIKNIIDAQATSESRLAVADDVLYNNGSLEDLSKSVEKLHQTYLQIGKLT